MHGLEDIILWVFVEIKHSSLKEGKIQFCKLKLQQKEKFGVYHFQL